MMTKQALAILLVVQNAMALKICSNNECKKCNYNCNCPCVNCNCDGTAFGSGNPLAQPNFHNSLAWGNKPRFCSSSDVWRSRWTEGDPWNPDDLPADVANGTRKFGGGIPNFGCCSNRRMNRYRCNFFRTMCPSPPGFLEQAAEIDPSLACKGSETWNKKCGNPPASFKFAAGEDPAYNAEFTCGDKCDQCFTPLPFKGYTVQECKNWANSFQAQLGMEWKCTLNGCYCNDYNEIKWETVDKPKFLTRETCEGKWWPAANKCIYGRSPPRETPNAPRTEACESYARLIAQCEKYETEPTEKMKCYQTCMPSSAQNPTGFPYSKVVTGKQAPYQNNPNGGKTKVHTDMRCGLATKIDITQGGTSSRCRAACNKCDSFFEDALVPWYGNGNGQMPDDWEGCFKWNVVWPCRNCRSPSNPNGPNPNRDGNDACKDTDVICTPGHKPCPNGVPKCFSKALDVPRGDECAPIKTSKCGNGNGNEGGENGNGNDSGKNGDKDGDEDDKEEEKDEENDKDKDEDKDKEDDDDDDDDEEDDKDKGDDKDEDDDEEEEEEDKDKETKIEWPKGDFIRWPRKPCANCANAFFKCEEANCDEWDCKWWCRCYQENVDYKCNDDGDDCECSSFSQNELYDLTYDDLIKSPYMNVTFTGSGAEELNRQARCIRDPTCEL